MPLDRAMVERVDRVASAFMERRGVPGLSIAVVSRGRLLYARGYGAAALSGERAGPVTPRTVFELGSIKKPITAAVVLRLAQRGLVDLDDPAGRWIARIRPEGAAPRLRDLLQQVSGLPATDDESVIRELEFEPRTRWAYRNANFDLLDDLVEKATGTPFPDHLRDTMMQPLGFDTLAMCDPADPRREDLAQGFTRRGGSLEPVEDACWLRGTPGELALWVDSLFSGRILPREVLDEMTAPVVLEDGSRRDYGFGLRLRPLRGTTRWSHSGHVDGFTASFGYYPAAGLTVAVAGNSDSLFDPGGLETAIAALLLGLPPDPPGRFHAGGAERFCGSYDAGEVWFRVAGAEGDGLSLSMTPPAEDAVAYLETGLTRVGETRYVGSDSPDVVEARFATGAEGSVSGAVFDVVGIPWEATRRGGC